jgi:hypothetical protein
MSSKRQKDKKVNQYQLSYDALSFELEAVKELNRMICKSVNQIKERKRNDLNRKTRKLNLESQQRIDAISQQFMIFLKSKNDSFEFKTEDEVTEILNEYFIHGLVLPDRFVFFVRTMSLVYLIVEFETFLKEILEATFEKKTEILTSSQKSLTLEELLSCPDLESAKRRLFYKVASEVVERPITKTFQYLEQTLGIDINGYNVNLKNFFERVSRRNALVHNQGFADEAYKRETGRSTRNINLEVSDRYLNETIVLFDSVANRLYNDLENKFVKKARRIKMQ